MAIPYRGEMFMGDVTEPTITSPFYLFFHVGVTDLPYVPGTAIVFTGALDVDDEFVPDGHCFPASEEVPTAGIVSNDVLALSAGATHARIYARVSCDDWEPE